MPALLLVGAVACPFAAAAPAAPDAGTAERPLRLIASILPLADVARALGGPAVEVDVLLPPGRTPHGFEPSPADAERLARADLLLRVGLDADRWAGQAASAGAPGTLGVLVMADLVERDSLDPQCRDDPHLWLDPVLMRQYAAALGAALAALRPAAAPAIRERTARYRAQLAALDSAYRTRLAAAPRKTFVALHSAFSHVAARYGLRQAAVFDAHLHEPGPGALERVVDFVRREGIEVLCVQPQIPDERAAWLREQTGLRIATLDPLGHPARPGYGTYLELMYSNLDELARALGAPEGGVGR